MLLSNVFKVNFNLQQYIVRRQQVPHRHIDWLHIQGPLTATLTGIKLILG